VTELKTCREELLKAVKHIVDTKGKNEFSMEEVIAFMKQHNTKYKESTIRTHLISRCCKNAPQHHGVVYEDYLRVGAGVYKLVNY